MSRLGRLSRIIKVAASYRLDEFIDRDSVNGLPAFLLRIAPWRLVSPGPLAKEERLRLALEELGPIYIKFGQMLSTRRDLLPDKLADELAKLQDNVPPFPEAESVAIIERELASSVDDTFSEFDPTPLASASVAQVHAARLKSGEAVVIKVIRPGIKAIIRQDIALMRLVARLLERFSLDARRLHPVQVVDDYQHTILDELDLQREAANTSQLKRNFAGSDLLHVPAVYWDYTSHNVFVMERIYGIAVTDMDELNRQGVNLKELAERGVEIFFTQVFRDSFFHADMHPGNIFVSKENPETPTYIAIDCAIIGSLSDFDQYYLARNMLAVFQRDYRTVAQLHVECGWVPPDTRVNDFESAMRAVCEPIFERPIGEISFGQMLLYLFQTARRFNMEVQPSLVLLQKTLLNIEGLGRQLYPELDLWTTAKPFLEKWVEERYSPRGIVDRIRQQLPSLLEQLPRIPDALLENIQEFRHADGPNSRAQAEIARLRADLAAERNSRRNGNVVLGLLVIGAFTLLLNL
ncbi:MAG: ubiquinone biosynthesis protein [Halieaceae bacterium]|jgi:ubiquinone biosynthesis protein